MKCENPGSRNPISRRLHRLECRECRANKLADQVISQGIERLNAEPISTDGMSATLALFGGGAAVAPQENIRAKTKRRHALLSLGSMTAFATVGAGSWLGYIDHDPNIHISSPAMPSPNAYDFLTAAVEAIPKYEFELSAGSTQTYKGKYLRAALQSTPERELALKKEEMSAQRAHLAGGGGAYKAKIEKWDHFYSLSDKESLLREYEKSLVLVRQSFTYAYLAPPVRSRFRFAADNVQEFLGLENAINLEEEVALSHGDYAKALNCDLDVMEFGALLTQGSALEARGLANSLEYSGRLKFWKLMGRLTAPQAKSAIHRLEEIIRKNASFVSTLEEEKSVALAIQEEQFQTHQWRSEITSAPYRSDDNGGDKQNPVDAMMKFCLIHFFSRSDLIKERIRTLDYNIAMAKESYSIQKNSASAPTETALGSLISPSLSASVQSPIAHRFAQLERVETQNALLLTALALHAFRLEHQDYPKQLTELVPDYLPSVPRDPFTNGGPLQYVYWNHKPISVDGGTNWYLKLYSIGPDCADNLGKPIQKKVEGMDSKWAITHPDEAFQMQGAVEQLSKGDIVAGINF